MFNFKQWFKISKTYSHKNCSITFLEIDKLYEAFEELLTLHYNITFSGHDIQNSSAQKAEILFFFFLSFVESYNG